MELTELRGQIDIVDQELVALLERRMDIASDIVAYKMAHGKPVLDSSREAKKIRDVKEHCRPETAQLIGHIFEDIMAASRDYQTRIMEHEYGK
jgi:monofunctional chorismate mutase